MHNNGRVLLKSKCITSLTSTFGLRSCADVGSIDGREALSANFIRNHSHLNKLQRIAGFTEKLYDLLNAVQSRSKFMSNYPPSAVIPKPLTVAEVPLKVVLTSDKGGSFTKPMFATPTKQYVD
jgi:hypothetical protein